MKTKKTENAAKLVKILRKAACAVIAAALCASLFSCGRTRNVLEYADENGKVCTSLNENEFSYFLSETKSTYLYSLGASGDSAEFWNQTFPGTEKTVGDIAFETLVDSGKRILAGAYLYDTARAEVKDESEGTEADLQLQKQVESVMGDLVKSKGSKGALEDYLSGFGTDYKNLSSYYEKYFKMAAVNASVEASEEEKAAYFANNYSIVKHILVNTSFKVKDDGSRVSLNEEEKAAKMALADAINLRLASGEEFEDLWEEYKDSDAAGAAKYPEGYFVCKNSAFTKEFEEAALDMAEGEVRTVNSTYGVHIIKKYPMDAAKYNLYSDVESDISASVINLKFASLLEPYEKNVRVDEDVLAEFDFVSAGTLLG